MHNKNNNKKFFLTGVRLIVCVKQKSFTEESLRSKSRKDIYNTS
jgi:hypothetical protein